ncbi:hypothetical protein JHK86_036864 [Glycine max]|nr:hypothetical protein JHK86_036864 [Glycine max]
MLIGKGKKKRRLRLDLCNSYAVKVHSPHLIFFPFPSLSLSSLLQLPLRSPTVAHRCRRHFPVPMTLFFFLFLSKKIRKTEMLPPLPKRSSAVAPIDKRIAVSDTTI